MWQLFYMQSCSKHHVFLLYLSFMQVFTDIFNDVSECDHVPLDRMDAFFFLNAYAMHHIYLIFKYNLYGFCTSHLKKCRK